jgi:hypothetical protein
MNPSRWNAFVSRALLTLAFAAGVSCPIAAQSGPTISIRVYNYKTGKQIVPSNFVINLDHSDEVQNQSLKIDEDGVGRVALPANATVISVQATYSDSTLFYAGCDADKKASGKRQWYALSDILKTGIVAANKCDKGKYEAKAHVTSAPGEFVFFVSKASNLDMSQ